MTKHTPGPWMPYDDGDSVGIYMRDDDGTCGPQVAEVLLENLEGDTDEQAHADAQLIAAAPDLLAVLKRLWAGRCVYGMDNEKMVKEAIAKAEGR